MSPQRVEVHYNLTTGRWTVGNVSASGNSRGAKICDVEAVTLTGCRFVVRETMRAAALVPNSRGKVERSVHAWVVGTWDPNAPVAARDPAAQRVTYNPYRAPWFHVAGDVHARVDSAAVVSFEADGSAWFV
jgi:hypothetical protein